MAQPEPVAETRPKPPPPWKRLPPEYRLLAIASAVILGAFVVVLVAGRRPAVAQPPVATSPPAPVATPSTTPRSDSDAWIQPLAGLARHVPAHDRRLFATAREGIAAAECRGGRCAINIEASTGSVVMAVHDGVIEVVERDPDAAHARGQEGRFIRINHNGGTVVSSYMQLDGIRADLKPGIPVKLGEPIATVGRLPGAPPHLRFAMSVRDAADAPELFVDPQPMLILWPMRERASASLHGMETPAER